MRVSIGQGGFTENGNTNGVPNLVPKTEHWNFRPTGTVRRAMSDDGQYVFFQSAAALTPLALSGYITSTSTTTVKSHWSPMARTLRHRVRE